MSEVDPAVGWRILLVEDDDADALLVREMLADGLPGARVERVTNLADARKVVRDADCVLLDMGLPDGEGITGVAGLVAEARDAAVVVLTGAASERQGVRAVAAGAQDYLVKGRVDDQLLARSIRYAIERQRAARLTRDLFAAERRRADNTRMERALIPTPLVRSADVSVAVRYRAGREGAELGGDFYDTVESADGTLTVLIGDVAGHGPDAAALGARLRSAWRALSLAGLPQDQVLTHLDEFLRTEVEALTFATVAVLEVPAHRATGRLRAGRAPAPGCGRVSRGRRGRGILRAPARGDGVPRVDPRRRGPGAGRAAPAVHRRADRGVGRARRRRPVRPRAADRADRRAGQARASRAPICSTRCWPRSSAATVAR